LSLHHRNCIGIISFHCPKCQENLRDERITAQSDKVQVVRPDYLEFRLTPTEQVQAPSSHVEQLPRATAKPSAATASGGQT
jgi:hypothetical protein